MRLSFPNAEQPELITQAGVISLGSNAENTVVLSGDGVQPLHATLFVDARGIVLNVLPPARVHVNARAVREKAILRLGDVVSIDTVQILLMPDRDDAIDTELGEIRKRPKATPAEGARGPTPVRAALRGISGAHFGRIVPLRGRLTVGSGAHCDVHLDDAGMPREHAAIEQLDDVIQLRDLGSDAVTRVNGIAVRNAVLYAGDQIAFERDRFVVEAPGLPPRRAPGDEGAADSAEQVQLTQSWRLPQIDQAPVRAPAPRGEIWWLIGAAALIGLAIAWALLIRF